MKGPARVGGKIARVAYPRLVTAVYPLIDHDGSYLPDLVILSIDLDPHSVGSARLSDVDVIELEAGQA